MVSCECPQGSFSAHGEPLFRVFRFDSQEQCACVHFYLATGVPEACLRLSNEGAGSGWTMHHCHHLAGLVLAWPENEHWIKSVAACSLHALFLLFVLYSAVPQHLLWSLAALQQLQLLQHAIWTGGAS